MNNFFLKLRLPENPIKDMKIIHDTTVSGGYNLVLPGQVLSDEIMDIFISMGLKPKFVSLFGRNDHDGTNENRMIHSDIGLNHKGEWQKILFGINWEVTGHENIFCWWDMSKVKECWPNEPLPKKYDYLNGIHYGKRLNLGVPDGAVLLEETLIDKPTLVRTDLPHSTVYKPGSNVIRNRIGISVRFFEEDFNSWDDVHQFFKPYSINE